MKFVNVATIFACTVCTAATARRPHRNSLASLDDILEGGRGRRRRVHGTFESLFLSSVEGYARTKATYSNPSSLFLGPGKTNGKMLAPKDSGCRWKKS